MKESGSVGNFFLPPSLSLFVSDSVSLLTFFSFFNDFNLNVDSAI